jgi:hypothetical protein
MQPAAGRWRCQPQHAAAEAVVRLQLAVEGMILGAIGASGVADGLFDDTLFLTCGLQRR